MSDEKQPLVDNYHMGAAVTVNEARADRGLGPLKLADGKTDDPDGELKMSAYEDKVRQAQSGVLSQQVMGASQQRPARGHRSGSSSVFLQVPNTSRVVLGGSACPAVG